MFRASVAMLAIAAIGAAGAVLAEDASTLAAGTCAACHGATGVSSNPQYPNLAGQKPAYLRRQLDAFRSGDRKSELMDGFAAALSDAEIAGLATFYARQPPAPVEQDKSGLAAAGRRIYRARGRGSPACADCHGSAGRFGFGGGMMGGGMMAGMRTDPAITPRLNRQHAPYLSATLDAFAKGTRIDATMAPIAAALTEAQRKAVAAYLAGLR